MEREYVISAEESASPGRYSFARYAYLRAVFDWFVDPSIEMIVLPKAAQTGWTAGFTGFLSSLIANDPSRILVALPTQEEAQIWSKDRFEPNVRATPQIRELLPPPKTRDGYNTILHKRFPGGTLKAVGANSATGLSSWPAKFAFADEVDRYPLSAGGEGDPIALMRKRLQTWLRLGGKIGLGSTPKVEQTSIIWHYYRRGDQQRWHCDCPHCGAEQLLEWGHVKWEAGRPQEAAYYCPHCGDAWTDLERLIAVAGGRWRATVQPADPKIRSALIDGLLSPHVTAVEMALEWESCETDEQKQAFTNLYLGLPWRVIGEAPDWQRLYDRRETWPGNLLPPGVLFLTAGVDVQKDRIEVRVWGWGRGQQGWLVDVRILEGDTSRTEVWERLTGVLHDTWRHASGAYMSLHRLAIDSGYATAEVYHWARGRLAKVMVIKGHGTLGAPYGVPTKIEVSGKKRRRGGVNVWPVGTSYCKERLYGGMRADPPLEGGRFPRNFIHLPDWVTDAEVRQMCSEELVTETTRLGFSKQVWTLIAGRRNEALDCLVYAFAAACERGLEKMQERHWRVFEQALGLDESLEEEESAAPAPPPRPQAAPVPAVEPAAVIQPRQTQPRPAKRGPSGFSFGGGRRW